MGSAWPLVRPIPLLLVLLSSASRGDQDELQIDFTDDIGKLVKGVEDDFLLQREVDLTELFGLEDFPPEQNIVSAPGHGTRTTDGVRPAVLSQPRFGPRSFGDPFTSYRVHFPLAKPTPENLHAICLHGDGRPRYPDSYFPSGGFGQQRRRASAVNRAEFWFGSCCNGNQTRETEVKLCCATQAWELSLRLFCEEESSVKDRIHHCCRLSGHNDRTKCFNNEAPDPNYLPQVIVQTQPPPPSPNFTFEPSACDRTLVTPSNAEANQRGQQKKLPTSMTVDMNFPLGRPTAETVKSMCDNQKRRPLYNVKCLPAQGYDLVARQARAVNHLENGFMKCCKKKKGLLHCADQKWRQEIDKFCSPKGGEQVDFNCCSAENQQDRYSCFQSISGDPFYNETSAGGEEITLTKLCEMHRIIRKRFPVGIPLKTFVKKCCPLSEEKKKICVMEKVVEVSRSVCSVKRPPAAVRRCCALHPDQTTDCIAAILKDGLIKAVNASHQRMRRRCPLA